MKSYTKTICLFIFGLFFGLLLVFPSAFAGGDELLTEKYFFSQEVFFIDDVDYTVNVGSSGDVVSVAAEGSYYFLNVDECETKNYIQICFESSQYDSSHDAYKVYLKVYASTPDLTITQVADETTLALGDETEITVTIANTGSVDSEIISYHQTIPEGFEIGSMGADVTLTDNVLSWSGSVKKSDSESFYYTLIATTDETVSLQGDASFFNGFTVEDLYSSTLSYTITSPHTTTITSNSTTVDVGGIVVVDVDVENDDIYKLNIQSLTIEIPEAFIVEKFDSRLEQNGSVFTYSGDLGFGKTANFEFELRARYDTSSDITAKGIIIRDGYESIIDSELELTSEIPELTFRPYMLVENLYPLQRKTYTPTNDKFTIEGNQNVTLELYVDSPTINYDIDPLTITLNSDLFPTQTVELVLQKKNSKKVLSYNFLTPEKTSSQTYNLDYTFEYTTEYGYSYVQEEEQTVSVQPIKDVDIKHVYETKTPTSGDTVKVSVTAKNTREINILNIALQDVIPDGLTVKGPTSATLDISSDVTVDAYEYYIIMPVVSEETKFEIITLASYSDATNDYAFNISSTFDLKPRTPDITLKKTTSTKTPLRGETVDIDYEIKNNEAFRVSGILITFPPHEKTYLVNDISYSLDTLDAGVTKTLSGIEQRIYLENTTDTISLPETIFLYTDELGLQYTDDTGKLSLKTAEGTITFPKLAIEKELVDISENLTRYTITITNFGTTDAIFTLYDAGEETELEVPAGEELTQEFEFSTKDCRVSEFTYTLPQSYLYFEHGNDIFYAVTGDIDLDIDDSFFSVEEPENSVVEESVTEEPIIEENVEPAVDEESTSASINATSASRNTTSEIERDEVSTDEPKTMGFFAKFVAFFKRIFSGSNKTVVVTSD